MPRAAAFGLAVTGGLCSSLRGAVLVCGGAAAPARRMPAISRPLVPSRELQAFVPDRALPRSEILKVLSRYVKDNKLQDPVERTVVNCDGPLRALFGVERCTFLGMNKYVSPHLRKPEEVGGKYLVEAKAFEEEWIKENGDKPVVRKKPKKRAASAEAKANGTGLWKPVQLSAELKKVCGKSHMPRQDVLKSVWAYIRDKNLQEGPGKPIKCDAALKKVFKVDEIYSKQIMAGISPHLTST